MHVYLKIVFSFILLTQLMGVVYTQVFNRAYNYFSEPFLNPNTGNLLYQYEAFNTIALKDSFFYINGTTFKFLDFNSVDQYIVKIMIIRLHTPSISFLSIGKEF